MVHEHIIDIDAVSIGVLLTVALVRLGVIGVLAQNVRDLETGGLGIGFEHDDLG